MKNLLLVFFLLITVQASAQLSLNAHIGLGFHGSGDLPGHAIGFGLEKTIKGRFSVYGGVRSTLHTRNLSYLFDTYENGDEFSYRVLTAGTQIEVLPTLDIIQLNSFKLKLRLGGIARYQASNNYYGVGTYAADPSYPVPLMTISAKDGKYNRTFTVGYMSELGMQFRVSPKSHVGVGLNLQNDLEGDLIWTLPFSYTYTF